MSVREIREWLDGLDETARVGITEDLALAVVGGREWLDIGSADPSDGA